MIVNRKPVDPSDPSTPEVIQLESAMGAAIGVFEGARALRVPRRRFAPVKTTDDLLAVRSDAYVLIEEAYVELARRRAGRPPVVELDPRFYKLLPDFEARFPAGPPSLVACERLRVVGDVRFGRMSSSGLGRDRARERRPAADRGRRRARRSVPRAQASGLGGAPSLNTG